MDNFAGLQYPTSPMSEHPVPLISQTSPSARPNIRIVTDSTEPLIPFDHTHFSYPTMHDSTADVNQYSASCMSTRPSYAPDVTSPPDLSASNNMIHGLGLPPYASHFHMSSVASSPEDALSSPRAIIHTPPVLPQLLPGTMPDLAADCMNISATSRLRASTQDLSRTCSMDSLQSSLAYSSAASTPSSASSSLPVSRSSSLGDIRYQPYSTHPRRQTRFDSLDSLPFEFPDASSDDAESPTESSHGIPGDESRGGPSSPASSKASSGPKRRKMWVHSLEKHIFTPEEIVGLGAQVRRSIYTASLEAHVDALLEQALSMGWYPIPTKKLEVYHGLNSKTAKSMVAGLHRDNCQMRSKIAELKRAAERQKFQAASGSENPAAVLSPSGIVAADGGYIDEIKLSLPPNVSRPLASDSEPSSPTSRSTVFSGSKPQSTETVALADQRSCCYVYPRFEDQKVDAMASDLQSAVLIS